MRRSKGGNRGAWLALAACTLGCACTLEPKPDADGLLDYAFDGPTPLQAAEMADNPYDANDRYRGTLMLANAYFASEPAYIALFERRIVDEDANVRSAGARGLANHGEPRHVAMLVKALQTDADAYVRREAARGLQRLHGPEAVGPLLTTIKPGAERDRDVRIAGATALGQYPEARVLDALMVTIEDDPLLAVNQAALISLRTLTGQELGLSRLAWVKWRESVSDPFAGRKPYIYPVFARSKYLYEYLPLVPPPPNEVAGQPVGLPPELRQGATPENPGTSAPPQEPAGG